MASPNLAIAASYSLEDFRRFLRTGIALGGRELPTMSHLARDRFAAFTDDEVAALHADLTTSATAGPS